MIADADKLYKIREIYNMLRQSFKNAFYSFQDLCIDENLLLYKGGLSFKQYIIHKKETYLGSNLMRYSIWICTGCYYL